MQQPTFISNDSGQLDQPQLKGASSYVYQKSGQSTSILPFNSAGQSIQSHLTSAPIGSGPSNQPHFGGFNLSMHGPAREPDQPLSHLPINGAVQANPTHSTSVHSVYGQPNQPYANDAANGFA